jgi:hypothetical protein
MEIQHAEFELSKKSLVKDLQNRCEKVSYPDPVMDSTSSQALMGRGATDAVVSGRRARDAA